MLVLASVMCFGLTFDMPALLLSAYTFHTICLSRLRTNNLHSNEKDFHWVYLFGSCFQVLQKMTDCSNGYFYTVVLPNSASFHVQNTVEIHPSLISIYMHTWSYLLVHILATNCSHVHRAKDTYGMLYWSSSTDGKILYIIVIS